MISTQHRSLYNPDGTIKTTFNPKNFINTDLIDTKLHEPELTDPKIIGNINYSSSSLATDINNKLNVNNPTFTGVMAGPSINSTNLLIPQSLGGVYFYGSTTANLASRFSYSATNNLFWDSYNNAAIQFRFGASPITKHHFFNNGDVSLSGNITSPTITTINDNVALKANQSYVVSEISSLDARIDVLEALSNISFSNLTGIASTVETVISMKRTYYADVSSSAATLTLPSMTGSDSKYNGWIMTFRSRQINTNSFRFIINCDVAGRFRPLGDGVTTNDFVTVEPNGCLTVVSVFGVYYTINKQDA